MKFRTFLTSLRYYFSEPAERIQAGGCCNPPRGLSSVKPGKKQVLVNVISLTGVKFWAQLSVTRELLLSDEAVLTNGYSPTKPS